SSGHSLRIHMQNETVIYTGKLDEVEALLNQTFIRVHKSYLVNLRFVEGIRGKEIFIADNQAIPVSRNYFKKARSAYYTYWGQRLQ
ncbi:MAG: LytTR family DNA-binding domain-containing protein, partial [Oscillospiraceae bacterium]